ncbi:hypothetical protein MNV49_001163 [Pseudohyphozyma bogoriensis]|nr:hypothetical protein MNV49_001163 [Pseudohyphozyma bogoriensis]
MSLTNLTIDALPSVVASLTAAISALPSNLVGPDVNLTALATLLGQLSASLEPVLPSLAVAEVEALYTNATWLTENLESVSATLEVEFYGPMLRSVSRETLIQYIVFGSTKFSITSVWAPAISSYGFLMRRSAISRARNAAVLNKSTHASVAESNAKVELELARKATGMITHGWNLFIGTVAFALQLYAWRLWVLPMTPFRASDGKALMAVVNLVLLSYGAELLFSQPHWYIVAHHFMSCAVPVVGIIAAYKTNTPQILRLGAFWMLQATIEQPTYAAMLSHF